MLDPEFVLSQARALDQTPQEQRQPLHGLAIGVKDVINTQDMPTQFGSPIYQGHQPAFDASVVGILRAAGALIFGVCHGINHVYYSLSSPLTPCSLHVR